VYIRRLRVFDNRVLKRIFGPNRNKVTGEWRKQHEELNDLYCSPSIVRVIKIEKNEMGGTCSNMGEIRVAYRILVGKPEGNKQERNQSRRR
jgi:hypothetical protein